MRPLESFVACPHSCIVADHVEQRDGTPLFHAHCASFIADQIDAQLI